MEMHKEWVVQYIEDGVWRSSEVLTSEPRANSLLARHANRKRECRKLVREVTGWNEAREDDK